MINTDTAELKQLLKSAYWKKQELKSEQDKIAELRSMAEKTTASYSLAPGGGDNTSKQEVFVIKAEDAIEHMKQTASDYVDACNTVHDLIETIEDDQLRTILKLRYLNYKKWEEIAVETGYTWRRIMQLHGKALQVLSRE